MHIGYVPQERPPFSALNFRSGAYNFHKFPKNPFRSITILHFFGDFAVPETIIFKISNYIPFIASHGRLSPNAKRSAAPRVSGRSGDSHFHAQNGSSSFRSPAFSSSKRLKLVPEPRIFKLKTGQARSGAPHFHARPEARSGALAHFSLCRGTYLPKFGVSTISLSSRTSKAVGTIVIFFILCWLPQVIILLVEAVNYRIEINSSTTGNKPNVFRNTFHSKWCN